MIIRMIGIIKDRQDEKDVSIISTSVGSKKRVMISISALYDFLYFGIHHSLLIIRYSSNTEYRVKNLE